jgi:signal transduction histidine kinase
LAFLNNNRSLLLLVYCGFQFTVLLFVASNLGLLGLSLPSLSPEVLVKFNRLVYVLRVGATVLLAWALLQPHRLTPLYLRGIQVMLGLCALSALLSLTENVRLAYRLSFVVFSMVPVWQLYGIWTAAQLSVQQRRIHTTGCGVYLVVLTLGLWLTLTDSSWLPDTGPVKQIVDFRLNGMAIGVFFFWITLLEHMAQKKTLVQELEMLRQQALRARTQQAELDERSGLIDVLTHELKNPLSTMRFALASMKHQAQGHQEWLMRIQSIDLSTRRMDDLIERVAHFNKIDRVKSTSSPTSLAPDSLIQELLSELSGPEQWQLRVEPGTRFFCDRQLLMVILDNLMSNARKYGLRAHPICIEVSRSPAPPPNASPGPGATHEGAYTRFEISNHVDTASAPEASRIFERYYRHPQALSQPGMGLGLSVVKTAAQKIGAHIAYRHADGQVFFTLTVPA